MDTFEPVDAVHPPALDRHLAFERHAERGEKSDSGCKVVDDDADVVQSLDRHVPSVLSQKYADRIASRSEESRLRSSSSGMAWRFHWCGSRSQAARLEVRRRCGARRVGAVVGSARRTM